MSTALKELLHPDIIQDIDQLNKRVQLKENAANAKVKSVWCWGLDKNTVVFKLDKNKKCFKNKSPFLNPKKEDIHKGCDYVIITKCKDRNVIIFCELKSNRTKSASKQLFYSVPFVDFLVSLLRTHKGKDIESFERHFVIFSSASRLRKQRTKNSRLNLMQYKDINIKMAGNPERINIGKLVRNADDL